MNESKPDINKVLFMHLVSMLAMSAIQQMGKLVDPGTGKAEINLEAAQATIDMLDMLEARTRGNLDTEETRLLKDTLMSLKMNYVQSQGEKTDAKANDGRRTPDDGPEKTEDKADARQQTTDGGPAKAEIQTPDDGHQTTEDGKRKADEDKTPKYHKKYE
ncbi:MAG: DUF1844 domain-containing protein [Kiritimatiellota bacterium]|nr:DUF1844 domain-containing protein [Kiritimatiellota bacterium]